MFDDSNKRYLQSILDSVSAGINLPVRLLSLEQLRNLSKDRIQLTEEPENLDVAYSEMKGVMHTQETVNSHNRASIESIEILALNDDPRESDDRYRIAAARIAEIEYDLFKTTASNSHTFIDLFRLSPEWRWFELLWMFYNKHLFKNTINEPFQIPAFGLPSWRFVCMPLSCDEGYLLVAGPLNFIEKNVDREHYFKVEGAALRDIYVKFNEDYCRRSVTKRFSTEELDRVLRLRVPGTTETVDSRVTLAEKVVSFVSNNCAILLSERHGLSPVEPTTLRATADLALAAGRLSQSHYFYELLSFHENNKPVINNLQKIPISYDSETSRFIVFAFTIPLGNRERLSLDMSVSVNRAASPDSLQWNFESMSERGVASDNRIITGVSVNGAELNDSKFLQSVDQNLERWDETSYARRNSYLGNRSNLIGVWLSHNFLKTKNDAENGNANVNGKRSAKKLEVYNVISDFIAESTRTEMCQIYRYHSHIDGGAMKVLGGSVRGGVWSTTDSDKVIEHMTNFAADKSMSAEIKLDRSIVYRAAVNRKMCYEEVSENGECCKVSWPSNVHRPRGIVAAPILIEGRVWGVIEIATPCAGAIETATQFSLSDYSGVLGVYLFSSSSRSVQKFSCNQ